MSTHSTHHFGGNAQHPPEQPTQMNADFTKDPLICGMEWNIQDDKGLIDLTWWMTWFDLNAKSWKSHHTTLAIWKNRGMDYSVFYDSFMGEGFSLIINLAEGGVFPRTQEALIDGQPQY